MVARKFANSLPVSGNQMTDSQNDFTRRDFLKQSAIAATALAIPGKMLAAASSTPGPAVNSAAFDSGRHPVDRVHPRLFGTREQLQKLAQERKTEYNRVKNVAADEKVDDYSWIISASLVAAIEPDKQLAEKVKRRGLKMVEGPIRVGHLPFGT